MQSWAGGGAVNKRSALEQRGAPLPPPRHMAPPRGPAWDQRLLLVLAVALLSGATALAVVRSAAGDAAAPEVTAVDDAAAIEICTQASLEDRAGLVLVVGLPGVTVAEDPLVDLLAEVGVGGVMLRDENITSERQATRLISGLRARLGDQLLVSVDDEGGRVTAMGALGDSIPSARRLGRQGRTAAREAGSELGERAASVGIDLVLAPVLDLDGGPATGVIGDRSFGDDPAEVAAVAASFSFGMRRAGVSVTLKHFPGHGGLGDPHLGDIVDESTLDELDGEDLVPFDDLIGRGAEAVMMGHVTYPSVWGTLPASLEPGAYELLRSRGFDGVAITDALGMGAVYARFGFDQAPALALAAGADALLVTQGDQAGILREGLVTAVREGRLDEARLDEAVARVLTLRGELEDGTVCPT